MALEQTYEVSKLWHANMWIDNDNYNEDIVEKLQNIIQKQKEEIRDFDTNQSNLDMRLGQIKLENDDLNSINKELRSELQENKVQINMGQIIKGNSKSCYK